VFPHTKGIGTGYLLNVWVQGTFQSTTCEFYTAK